MCENSLKVSIITVCLNAEKTIERTIQSVTNQTYSNIEYIIIDGKSTDKTLEIINRYKDKISTIFSEKDHGIYDAMNKGIKLACGDVIYFLNAGDYLHDFSIVEKIVSVFTEDNSLDMVYGDVMCYDECGQKEYYKSSYISDRYTLFTRGIWHQSIFARKSVFNKFGNFNLKYSIFADHDWILRVLLRHHIKSYYYNTPISFYLLGGMSQDCNIRYANELEEIVKKYKNINLILMRYKLQRYLSKIKRFFNI